MSGKYEAHGEWCPWHNDQRDSDCRCSASRAERVAAASDAAFGERPFLTAGVDVARDRLEYEVVGWPGGVSVERGTIERQSKADSFMESLTNIAIGLAVSQVANLIVLPLVFGVPVSGGQAFALGVIYTAISLVRSYAIRRAFNGRTVWSTIKARFA